MSTSAEALRAVEHIPSSQLAGMVGVSKRAVNGWRRTGHVPPDRIDQLLKLGGHREPAGTADNAAHLLRLRDLEQRQREVERTRASAHGLPPDPSVPGYWLMLATLALIELPTLVYSVADVADMSLAVAAVTALAFSVFVVGGAHIAGALIRGWADRHPGWARGLAFAAIAGLMTATSIVAIDLRANGFDQPPAVVSLFADRPAVTGGFRDYFRWASMLIPAGVAIMATVLSVGYHTPQTAYAIAERRYRKAMRRMKG